MTVAAKDNDVDALMLALTDDPVPDGARADPGFAAEHAAAVADVALLRERLGAVGDALAARPAPPAEPVPLCPPRRRRDFVAVVFVAVAAVVAAALVSGAAWLVMAGGPTAGDDSAGAAKEAAPDERAGGGADADQSPEGFVACSRLIAEGTVTEVTPVPGAERDRITVEVSDYLKPTTGPATITFPMVHDVDPRLKKGDRTLITIPKGAAEPDNWATGKDRAPLRKMITKALPKSQDIRCDGRPGPGD
ncbi:hypothetical protein [Streptomyces sp. NPDC052114]|uniref:hypothetical protein n=1 Tax=unclassified Streptomyces TaxID=2593676 RepID=UPI00344557BF